MVPFDEAPQCKGDHDPSLGTTGIDHYIESSARFPYAFHRIFSCSWHFHELSCHSILPDVISLSSTLKHGGDGEVALAVSEGEQVYAGDSLSNLTQLDLSSEKTHKPILTSSFHGRSDKISELKCVGDNLFICLENIGSVLVSDQRTDSIVREVKVQKDISGLWTMDTTKDLFGFVALASSCGCVSVYDLRSTQKESYSCSSGNAQNLSQRVTVHLSPFDSLLSVSGFDKTVEIHDYKCGGSDGKVFSHDGHRGEGVQGIVTHMWHPAQRKLLFSADDTGKLNAWRFKLLMNT